jgi:hypothetical protein
LLFITYSLSLLSKSQTMKKLTLLLVAAVMISGGAFAGGKDCCKKKGEKCNKETAACCKDKKNCKHECSKDAKAGTDSKALKQESTKKAS